ncbi:hypothetical protein Bbelb_080940 [Branchiostoma belcheri]|nr:hypothetical protein Bbelb_080940 [Branchiostoma belcheri]
MASGWTYIGIAVLLLLVTLTVNGSEDDTERVAKTLERSHVIKHLQEKRLTEASVHRNRKDKLEKQFEEKRNQEGWPTRLGRKASFQENDDYFVREDVVTANSHEVRKVVYSAFPKGTRSVACQDGEFATSCFRVKHSAATSLDPTTLTEFEQVPVHAAAWRDPSSEVTASLRRTLPDGARSDFKFELKSIRRPRGARNGPAAVGKPAGLRPGPVR